MNQFIEKCVDCRGTAAESVVKWDCLPVKTFGGFPSGVLKAVTIGLNPALNDWLDNWGDPSNRAAILADYHRQNREDLSEKDCLDAIRRNGEYFWNPHKPIYPYFESLEMLLARIDHRWSYVLGTVAHVDLVACPTEMRFGAIPTDARIAILKNCEKHFLKTIHNLPDKTVILLNGKRAIATAHKIGQIEPKRPQERINWGALDVVAGKIKTEQKTFIFCGWDQQAAALPVQFKIDLAHWIRGEVENLGGNFD